MTVTYYRRDSLSGDWIALLKFDDAIPQGYSWTGDEWIEVPIAGFLREDDVMRVEISEDEALRLMIGGAASVRAQVREAHTSPALQYRSS